MVLDLVLHKALFQTLDLPEIFCLNNLPLLFDFGLQLLQVVLVLFRLGLEYVHVLLFEILELFLVLSLFLAHLSLTLLLVFVNLLFMFGSFVLDSFFRNHLLVVHLFLQFLKPLTIVTHLLVCTFIVLLLVFG
jgi:hypothetical protein